MIQNFYKDIIIKGNKYVPYFKKENFFDDLIYKKLYNNFPITQIERKFEKNKKLLSASLNFENPEDKNFLDFFLKENIQWKCLCDYFFSEDFKKDTKVFIRNTELPDGNKAIYEFDFKEVKTNIHFTCSKSGFELPPHTDASKKIIALIIYFADDDWNGGTNFFFSSKKKESENFIKKMSYNRLQRFLPFNNLKLKNCHIQKGYEIEFGNIFDTIKYEAFQKNKMAGFIKTNYSFHSVPKILSPEKILKKSLLVNLNFK